MNFINFVFIIFSLLILIPGIKIAKKGEFHENPYDLKITKGIAGYFAFCVLLHHIVINLRTCSDYYEENFTILEHSGVLLVGFFFLFSGYGLIVSYEEKNNYMKTFLFRRVCTILLPFFLCNYAFMTTSLLMGNRFSMKDLLLAFFGLILLNSHMWFAVEIMLLYLAFYIIFRFLHSDKAKYLSMTAVVLVIMVTSFLLGHEYTETGNQINWFHGEWWYNTTPLFLIGMAFAKYRKKVMLFARTYYTWLIIGSASLFLIFRQGTEYMLLNHGYWTETEFSKGYTDKLMTLSFQLPMVIFFEIFLLLLLMKVRFHNKTMKFLGKISLELILLENVFLLLFAEQIDLSLELYVILVIATTLVFATIINKIKLFVLEKKD